MDRESIREALHDCKNTNRYVVSVSGDKFWVFGMTDESLLVRRVVAGIMKPLSTLNYSEVKEIITA